MKPVTWIRFFLLCVVIGQFRAVEARNVHFTPQEKTDTLINPPLIKGAEHILRFDETVLNIGTLTEDDAPKMYRFTCTNVSGNESCSIDLSSEESSWNNRYECFCLSVFFGQNARGTPYINW